MPIPRTLRLLRRISVTYLVLLLSSGTSAQVVMDTALNFLVKDVEGNSHRLYNYLDAGKLVVVDFFTVTCGPCASYAPEISASYMNFGCNSGNVVVLGINWGADNAQVMDFAAENGAVYPEASGLEGNGNHVIMDYSPLSYPTVILIKPDRSVDEPYIWPPSTVHLDSLIALHGGMVQPCTTGNRNDLPLQVSVYPNPCNRMLHVALPGALELSGISLVSSLGRVIRELNPGDSVNGEISLDTGELAAGVYWLVCSLPDHSTARALFIKEN